MKNIDLIFTINRIKKNLLKLSAGSVLLVLILTACEKDVTVTEPLKAGTGVLELSSKPTNAKIYWEGYYTGFKTPHTFKNLEEKNQDFVLKLENYKDTLLNVNIDVNETKQIFVDYTLNPNMYGSIQCFSSPKNAEIFINDSSTGKTTPATLSNIVPGKYNIKFSYPEHRSNNIDIVVKSSATRRTQLSLVDTSIWVDYQEDNSGLTDNYLTCVAVDKNNVKWMGTSSVGVLTFDGTNWGSFSTANSLLPSDNVREIGIDPRTGKVWICTAAGVGIYDGSSWEVYTPFNSILNDANITSIDFSSDGKTWLGTEGEGLAVFDGTTWEIILGNDLNRNYPSTNISDILVDNTGKLWTANLNKGFNSFDGTDWYRYFWHGSPISFLGHGKPGEINSNRVKSIGRDSQGRLWIGHWGSINFTALSMFDESTFYDFGTIIDGEDINCIFVDDHDNKWIGTESSLTVFKEVTSRIVYLESNSGLTSNYITEITQDNQGVIWISTYGGGLIKFKGEL